MSENESLSSAASDTESTDGGEDVVEQTSAVQPYMFEPLACASDPEEEETDEDGIPRANLEARLSKTVPVTSWCTCGHCSDTVLQDAREYRCCKEIAECVGKFTKEGIVPDCITQHSHYPHISHRAVLETAGALLTDKSGKKYRTGNNSQNEYLRAVAYRWVIRWLCGCLGWGNSRPLSACIYADIRKRYASGSTSGYKSAQERH